MPRDEKLPLGIQPLAFRNALPLDSGLDFHNHAERLINGICGIVGGTHAPIPIVTTQVGSPSRNISTWLILTVAVFAGAALLAMLRSSRIQQTAITQGPTSAIGQSPSIEATTAGTRPIILNKISIQNGAVWTDGAWIRNVANVLGKPERIESTHDGEEIDIWDSIGLRVRPNGLDDLSGSLDVFLSNENKVTNTPEKTFQGELLIEGFSVSSRTNIMTLNAGLGSKALTQTDAAQGGEWPIYTGQYADGAITITCDPKGIIYLISVSPRGGLQSEPPTTTSLNATSPSIFAGQWEGIFHYRGPRSGKIASIGDTPGRLSINANETEISSPGFAPDKGWVHSGSRSISTVVDGGDSQTAAYSFTVHPDSKTATFNMDILDHGKPSGVTCRATLRKK
jgi:hypothetical protein